MNDPKWMDKYVEHWDSMHEIHSIGFSSLVGIFVLGISAIVALMVLY